ncbi:MAG TPA: hypothetical protein P5055_22360 [Candidatus Paceibacterota bacterium]|nr:hypothetical protein [Candidatus Paceibacterota bacterium]
MHGDGTVYPVEVHMQLCGPKENAVFLAVILDITERKRVEDQIQRQLEELERWYKVTLGSEKRVMQLKSEVNELLARLGEPARYASQAGASEPLPSRE